MNTELAIRLKNHLAELGRLADAITAFGEQQAWPPKTVFEVNLILEELATNVIRYGYDDGAEHEFLVQITAALGGMEIWLEDDGKAFNPLDLPKPDLDQPLEDRPIGGLGIYLVRKMTDRMEYRRENGKNILVLRKHVSEEA